ARVIAQVLGATHKSEGFYRGKAFLITWTLGPSVVPIWAQGEGSIGGDGSSLPFLPQPFTLGVRRIKKDYGVVRDNEAARQLEVVSEIFNRCQSIIVATSPHPEGMLIFRYVYDFLKCTKPFER